MELLIASVETQHTIGYGGRQTTEECPEAIAVMSFQVISFILSTSGHQLQGTLTLCLGPCLLSAVHIQHPKTLKANE